MATAKKATPKKAAPKGKGKAAPAAKPGKSLMTYDEMMAKLQEKTAEAVNQERNTGAGGMPNMGTLGKDFAVSDEESYGDSIQVVVIASAFLNAYYDSPYSAGGEKGAPACYAVAHDEDDLAPPDDVPHKQNDTCDGCPLNEYGTATTGNGKACGNRRRLIFLLVSDLLEGIVRPIKMSIPPTSLKFWGKYVKAVARSQNLPPSGVITRFDFDEENPQPAPVPTFESVVGADIFAMVFDAIPEAEDAVLEKIDTSGYVEPTAKKKASGKMGRKPAPGAKGKAKPKARR